MIENMKLLFKHKNENIYAGNLFYFLKIWRTIIENKNKKQSFSVVSTKNFQRNYK